jgi:RIO kinase 1
MSTKSPAKFKVYKNVLDDFTVRTLFELGSKGLFDREALVPFSMGKESNVFFGTGKSGDVIVKIYRLQSCDFNRMYDYIKFDPRFIQLKKQRRKVILSWVQREYRNLLKAREAGVSAPTPYAIQNNVIVMKCIGKENPAPKLKDLAPKKPQEFLGEVIKNVERYYLAGFVHGDLSKFNILNDDERPVLIDFSQSTTTVNQNAEEYLRRDVKNICDYFQKIGAECDPDMIVKSILDNRKKQRMALSESKR